MELKLKNPIIFFDLETTGVNVAADRIVEISWLKISPSGEERSQTQLVNPTIPIPPVVTEIHGISDDDVKDKPTFSEIARTLANEFEGCDLAGYNSNKFDIPLLAEEFLRADVDFDMRKRKFIDVQVIFHKMEQRTLSAGTYEILKAQLDRYDELQNDIDQLSAFSSQHKSADLAGRIIYNDKDIEVFNFGKYKGKSVEEVLNKDPGYFSWILNGDFPLYTKKVLTAIKLRTFGK